ncbi:MAG: TatD family hydrolase [Pseudomonadota bacterium]
MLIDSHAHLDMPHFDKDREQVLERAVKGGIRQIITIGVDLSSSLNALELAHKYDFIFSTVGYHPHNTDDMDWDHIKELERLASEPKIVAWGEIGLDYYRRLSSEEKQLEAFKQQIDMANHHDLPVIIHDREAHGEVFEILKGKKDTGIRGVLHCFSGDYKLAMAFIEMGYYISIPGTVTYKKAFQVQEVATKIPIEYMLLETDAPYLAPVPMRGKRNEPFFVTYTAQKIAELREMDFGELTRQTSKNARCLFNLPNP